MLGQIYCGHCRGYHYVGKHDGDIFEDDYYGSGIAWNNVVNKYGKKEIVREIMDTYDTKEQGDELEKKYIMHARILYGDNCLNIADGGQGGNLGEAVNRKISENIKGPKNGMYGKTLSEETRLKIKDRLREIGHKPNKGKRFDSEWIRKLSESHIGKNVGKRHTYEERLKIKEARARQTNLKLDNWKGHHWYTNGVDSHMYLDGDEPEGWYRGRTVKR